MSVDGVWSRPQRLPRVASHGEGGRGAINESVKTRKQPSSASPQPRRIASRRFASVHVSRLALFGRLSLGTEWNVGLMMLCIGHLAILVISRVSFTRYDTSVLRQLCVTTILTEIDQLWGPSLNQLIGLYLAANMAVYWKQLLP